MSTVNSSLWQTGKSLPLKCKQIINSMIEMAGQESSHTAQIIPGLTRVGIIFKAKKYQTKPNNKTVRTQGRDTLV